MRGIASGRLGTVAVVLAAVVAAAWAMPSGRAAEVETQGFRLPTGTRPHGVALTADGGAWFTGEFTGTLGRLDPASGQLDLIQLGAGAQPRGLVVGPGGDLWITDAGRNAIVRVVPATGAETVYPIGRTSPANLSGLAFDGDGVLWFTGQSGVYGRLDPESGTAEIFRAPRGPGPYGITTTPDGEVFLASINGDYLARIDRASGQLSLFEVPVPPPAEAARGGPGATAPGVAAAPALAVPRPPQGPRRLASDSQGRIWVSEWFAGELAVFDPADESWREWPLPGSGPQPYALYVDEADQVWISDSASDSILRFDPQSEVFERIGVGRLGTRVRQLAGRPGEVWATESGTDHLALIRVR